MSHLEDVMSPEAPAEERVALLFVVVTFQRGKGPGNRELSREQGRTENCRNGGEDRVLPGSGTLVGVTDTEDNEREKISGSEGQGSRRESSIHPLRTHSSFPWALSLGHFVCPVGTED